LGSRLHVFGPSTPKQWTIRLDLQKFTLQQTLTTMEVIKRNTHQMNKLIVIKVNNGRRATTKFLHITKTLVHQTTPEDHPTNIL
jgi:hypothetical protein